MSSITFKLKDILHKSLGKFVPAWLPNAKKPYNLRAVFQPGLDIHGIASKAEVYNIETDPKVIEEGFNAACELVYYLAAAALPMSAIAASVTWSAYASNTARLLCPVIRAA
jgi:hypothetical protein